MYSNRTTVYCLFRGRCIWLNQLRHQMQLFYIDDKPLFVFDTIISLKANYGVIGIAQWSETRNTVLHDQTLALIVLLYQYCCRLSCFSQTELLQYQLNGAILINCWSPSTITYVLQKALQDQKWQCQIFHSIRGIILLLCN